MKRQAIITILLAFVAVLGQAQTTAPQEKKQKTSLFALFSIRFALPLPENLRFACRDEMGMG